MTKEEHENIIEQLVHRLDVRRVESLKDLARLELGTVYDYAEFMRNNFPDQTRGEFIEGLQRFLIARGRTFYGIQIKKGGKQ